MYLKSRNQLGVLLAGILVISAFSSLFGENKKYSVQLTPWVGGYVFEGNQHMDNNWTPGISLGYNFNHRWGIEANYHYVDSDYASRTGDIDSHLGFLDILYHFRTSRRFVPYVALGGGGISFNVDPGKDESAGVLDYGGGFKYFVNKERTFSFRMDMRGLVSFDDETNFDRDDHHNNLLARFGLHWQWGGEHRWVDSDKDGVPDRLDKCKETPLGAKVDKDGCPLDSDGDGVFDYKDNCPNTPKGVKVDLNGCPLDTDGDGIYDYLDKSPKTPTGVQVDEDGVPLDLDKDGVPDYLDKSPGTPAGVKVDAYGAPLDEDRDGVADYLDHCPGTPIGTRVDSKGCTLILDSDGDGVPDDKDHCPGTPLGAKVDSKGCWVLTGLNFANGRAVILNESVPMLDSVAQVLLRNPLIRMEIQGHTDSSGPDSANLALSQKRALAVKQFLVDRGILASQLIPRGYGEAKPVASNLTKEGRAQNRRVELIAVK